MADELVGGVQNGPATAVVLFELDLVAHLKLTHEVSHVAHTRTAEGIDALVIIAHREHRRMRPAQLFDPGVLQAVGVLKLVDQQVTEAPLVVLPYGVVVA